MMTIQEFQLFMTSLRHAINTKHGEVSASEAVMWCMIKLSEEVGELAEQVMKRRGRQDERKGAFEQDDLEGELADVMIATMMIPKVLGIDMTQVLEKKMKALADKRNI